MRKSIQWKILIIFFLLVLSVMITMGTYMLRSVDEFFLKAFVTDLDSVFTTSFIDELGILSASNSGKDKIPETLSAYNGRLGIDAYRYIYILDGKNGAVSFRRDGKTDEVKITPNILSALSGKMGTIVDKNSTYMDYAIPIKSGDNINNIVYIKDTKQKMRGLVDSIFNIALRSLVLGLFVAIILGFILSRSIKKPIAKLTKSAVGIASGNFENFIEIKYNDEIGKLTEAFNHMAGRLKDTMNDIQFEKNKVETILMYMSDGVMAFDTNGEIIHINPAARIILGIDDEAGLNFDEIFINTGVNIKLGELLYYQKEGSISRSAEIGGRFIKVQFATFKQKNEDKTGGVIAALYDITEQEKLDMSRREFVANVSHELRTPLTTIKSYTETLMESDDISKEQSNKFLGVINNETDRMTRIVKDLLTLSSLDNKKMAMNKDEVQINELIMEIIHKLYPMARKKDQDLEFLRTTNVPVILADKDRLEQVIINIIANAIKYTQDGGSIEVFAGKMYNNIYIKVKDNGVGIPKEDMPRIFERFYRVDKARTRSMGGTGLGLSISKEIVDAHGGKISIRSKVEKGTEVIIYLPIDEI